MFEALRLTHRIGIATDESVPRAEIMNYDSDMVRILKRSRGALVRGIIEVPFRGEPMPHEFVEVM